MNRVGQELDGRWTLERVIGKGGMGVVYEARDSAGARAAVKVLHPPLARQPEVRERFRREGSIANRIDHAGVVRVLGTGVVPAVGPEEPETFYLAMEKVEGESLEDRILDGRAPTELELLAILDGALGVLAAAHAAGVLHRDLKPANLLLTASGDPIVKVLDFGLARIEDLAGVTGAGLTLGTPCFMAPELAGGQGKELDARTDLFALGATAFLVLAGRPVHEADSPVLLVMRMASTPSPSLATVAPGVSPVVARLVDRALAFAKEDRPPSAEAMRDEVRAAIDDVVRRA